jgi:hypothetical protein
VICSLICLSLLACGFRDGGHRERGARNKTPRSLPITEPMVLGWRLVPGDQLVYDHSVIWQASPQESTRRVERWTYLVRDVDPQGIATLEGSLTALGVERILDGQVTPEPLLTLALSEEKERLSQDSARILLAMDGRLVEVTGVSWSDSLSHRLLGLQLSGEGIMEQSSWPDPVLARPYADLLPMSLDVEVSGAHTVAGLYDDQGGLRLSLLSEGLVRSTNGGPQVELEGQSWWDPQTGRLVSRELMARVENLSTTDPGTLTIELKLVE